MKKKLALILAAALLVSLFAGCGKQEPASSGTSSADGSSAQSEDQALKAAVFYYSFADPFLTTVRTAMDEELTGLGVEFENFDAAADQNVQQEQVNRAIEEGFNLLILNVVNSATPDAAQAAVDAARESRIPVILFNREVEDSVLDSYENAAFVGTDAPEAGHLQGRMVGEYLLEHWDQADLNGDGKISYVMFKGQEGNMESEARTRFSVEDANAILTEAGKPELEFYDARNPQKYLVDTGGAWSAAAAADYMTVILREYNDVNENMVELVIANNDDMAEGALSCLQEAGYNRDSSQVIPVFGVDALASAVEKVDSGLMAGTIRQNGEAMASAVAALVKNLRDGRGLTEALDSFRMDEDVAKIRVPYEPYTK